MEALDILLETKIDRIILLSKQSEQNNQQLLQHLENLEKGFNIWTIRDCDLLAINQYREEKDYKIRVNLKIENDSVQSSIVVGDRLVQDSSKYCMSKGCLSPILTNGDVAECLDKVKDIFGLPVEVEVHQIGEEQKDLSFKSNVQV